MPTSTDFPASHSSQSPRPSGEFIIGGQQTLRDLNDKLRTLRYELTASRERCEFLTAEVNRLRADLCKSNTQRDELSQKIDFLGDTLSESITANVDRDNEIARLKSTIELLTISKNLLQLQYDSLTREKTGIPITQWRRLVQLCHPDKHNHTVAANEATRWLIANKPEGN